MINKDKLLKLSKKLNGIVNGVNIIFLLLFLLIFNKFVRTSKIRVFKVMEVNYLKIFKMK